MIGLILAAYVGVVGVIFPLPPDTNGMSFNPMSGWQPDTAPFPGALRAEDGSWVPPTFYAPQVAGSILPVEAAR